MKRVRLAACFAIACFISGFFGHVSIARADEPIVRSVERQFFYLDESFLKRSVTLDIGSGRADIRWDAGDLLGPTTLLVEIESGATSSQDGVELSADRVRLSWSDPNLVSPRGVQLVSHACASSVWSRCTLYQAENGVWKEVKDERVRGQAYVRFADHQLAYMSQGSASWYRFKNCRCAASPDFAKGTRVRVRSQLTGKFTVVRINDWGPERDKFPDRAIDLDAVAFKELAPLGAGVINVSVEPLDPADADYGLADVPVPEVIAKAVKKKTKKVAPPEKKQETVVWNY